MNYFTEHRNRSKLPALLILLLVMACNPTPEKVGLDLTQITYQDKDKEVGEKVPAF